MIEAVRAVAAVAVTLGTLEGVPWVNVLAEDPGLDHVAGLVVGSGGGEARRDEHQGRTIERASTLPEDVAVRFWHE